MSIGKQEELQGTMWLSYDQLPKSMGHAFYGHLQRLLLKGQFDSFAEKICEPYYAKGKGRPSVPPGRYFRMLLVGYFEGIESERGSGHRTLVALVWDTPSQTLGNFTLFAHKISGRRLSSAL